MIATFPLRKTILLLVMMGVVVMSRAHAQTASTITFPIPELGNCADQAACKTYCSDSTNQKACVEFGTKHNLIKKATAVEEKRPFSGTGPGGCTDQNSCHVYCEDTSHGEECLSFAEKNGLMKKEDLERARKFIKQTGPGGCKGDECRTYCADVSHIDECVKFAEDNNFISKEDASRAKKMMQAAQKGGPGGCRGEECRAYCMTTEHQKECYEFAKKEGFTRPEDDKNFEVGQKLNQAIEVSGGPGGCKSEGDCRAYCTDPSHVEECIAFASSHGGVTQDQAQKMLEQFTKQKQQGELGHPVDQKTIDQETEKRFQKFREFDQQFRGSDGSGIPPFGEMPQGNMVGPSGCASAKECGTYCAEHQDECAKFNTGALRGAPEGAVQQPCTSKEECARIIKSTPRATMPVKSVIPLRGGPGDGFTGPGGCTTKEECLKAMNSMVPNVRPAGMMPTDGSMGFPNQFTKPEPAPAQFQGGGLLESGPVEQSAPEPLPQSAKPLNMFLGMVVGFFIDVLR